MPSTPTVPPVPSVPGLSLPDIDSLRGGVQPRAGAGHDSERRGERDHRHAAAAQLVGVAGVLPGIRRTVGDHENARLEARRQAVVAPSIWPLPDCANAPSPPKRPN